MEVVVDQWRAWCELVRVWNSTLADAIAKTEDPKLRRFYMRMMLR